MESLFVSLPIVGQHLRLAIFVKVRSIGENGHRGVEVNTDVVDLGVLICIEVGVEKKPACSVPKVVGKSKDLVNFEVNCVSGNLGDMAVFVAHWNILFGQHFAT